LSIAERLREVQRRIQEAAARAGRDPSAIRLVAVTKTVPPERLREAVEAGLTDFGENRVQEALKKMPLLPATVTWHMVGRLQTNKARDVVSRFSLVHSVDRMAVAEALSREAVKQGKMVSGLLQVNVSGEPTKAGFSVAELPEAIQKISVLPSLQVTGLMTIAPYVPHAEQVRPVFQTLKRLFDEWSAHPPSASGHWQWLSMGMSNDFEVAVEEGANLLRIGTAIFGERAFHHQRSADGLKQGV